MGKQDWVSRHYVPMPRERLCELHRAYLGERAYVDISDSVKQRIRAVSHLKTGTVAWCRFARPRWVEETWLRQPDVQTTSRPDGVPTTDRVQGHVRFDRQSVILVAPAEDIPNFDETFKNVELPPNVVAEYDGLLYMMWWFEVMRKGKLATVEARLRRIVKPLFRFVEPIQRFPVSQFVDIFWNERMYADPNSYMPQLYYGVGAEKAALKAWRQDMQTTMPIVMPKKKKKPAQLKVDTPPSYRQQLRQQEESRGLDNPFRFAEADAGEQMQLPF